MRARPTPWLAERAAEQAAGGELDGAVVGGLHDDVAVDLGVHEADAAVALQLHHVHGAIAQVRTAADDLRVAAALVGGVRRAAAHELEAGLVVDAEAIRDMLPVGAADDERLALLEPELIRRAGRAPERPEVDVFHAAHVEAVIDEQPAIERGTVEIANVDAGPSRGRRNPPPGRD